MVGACAACLLGRAGLRVALLGRAAAPWQASEHDLRVSAVNRASESIFVAAGAWSAMLARRVSPFRHMQVWNESGLIRFDAVDTGETHLGHIVENGVVVAGLLEQAARDTAVEVLVPAQVETIETADACVRVVTAEHGILDAALLLGADGAHSQVRDALDIAVQDRPYGQRAIVATVRTELAHRETAWQRFLATGPLAFLPLADGRCSIVWSCDDDTARAVLDYDDEQFCEALSSAFERRLGEVTETGERRAFPLVQRHAQTYLGRRTALLGDAAHVTHVLAGLGANLGFLDAAALAEIVADAAARGQDIGAHRVLRRYERWRRSENALVLSIMAGFKNVFGHRATWLRRLGGESLSAADWAAPAKRMLMRRAMGLSGELPQAARRAAPTWHRSDMPVVPAPTFQRGALMAFPDTPRLSHPCPTART